MRKVILASNPKYIKGWVKYYKDNGCKIDVCKKCGRIIHVQWPNHGIEGPSLSSGMYCSKIGKEHLNGINRSNQ